MLLRLYTNTFSIGLLAVAMLAQAGVLHGEEIAEPRDLERLQRGAELANRCAICHLEPDPSILPKRSWQIILGDMGNLLGVQDKEYFENTPGFARVSMKRREALSHFGLLPPPGLITQEQWSDLKYYYLSSAPDDPLPAQSKPDIAWDLDDFEIIRPASPIPRALTTLVRIRESEHRLYVGDSGRNTLTLFDSKGERIAYPRKFRPDITPVDIEFTGETAFIASIGDIGGSDMIGRSGHIIQLDLSDDDYLDGDDFVFADSLPRLADICLADFDGNGSTELIASGFGTAVGEITLFPDALNGSSAGKVILDMPGAVRAAAYDFNNDGLLDVGALVSNAREGFHILENRGNLTFTDHTVFETHPGMGHTYFELQDFNDDQQADLLVVNGDNVDSDPYNTYKNFHGIRIYLNRGDLTFEQAYFYPMRGAFMAKAADYDLDGDLDIAAIAFYPDFEADRPESFVFLENQGLQFRPRSMPELCEGRWMTMDAGDLDGDGDADLVLGGAYVPIGMSQHMEAFEHLAEVGPAFAILRNNAKSEATPGASARSE